MSLFLKENNMNGKWQSYEAMIGKTKQNKTTNFHIALLIILFKLSKIKVFLFKEHLTLEIYPPKKLQSKIKIELTAVS